MVEPDANEPGTRQARNAGTPLEEVVRHRGEDGLAVSSRFRVNTGAMLAGNVLYAASQWMILVVLARFGDASEVGAFALALAIVAPIFTLADLDLQAIQGTDAGNRYRFSDFLGLRYLSIPLAVVISIIAGVLLSGALTQIAWVVGAVALSKGVESLSLITYGLYQKSEHMTRTAVSLIVKGWGGTLVFGIVYALTASLPASVLGMSSWWTAVMIVIDGGAVQRMLSGKAVSWRSPLLRASLRGYRPRFRRSVVFGLFLLALPAGVSSTIGTLTVQIPRYFIDAHVGTAALGIFASLAYFVRAVEMVSGAMGLAMMPRLARYLVAGEVRAFVRLLVRCILAASILGVLGIAVARLAGDQVLTLMYGKDFARQDVFVGLMIAGLLVMVAKLLGSALIAMRWLRTRMAIYIIGLVIIVMASALMIPRSGLMGAATALILAFGWRCFASAVVVLADMLRRGRTAEGVSVQ